MKKTAINNKDGYEKLPSFKFTPPAPNESNQNQFDLSEKFEDWYYEKEYEHLKNGTEFKPNEMFEFLKPYLKVSK